MRNLVLAISLLFLIGCGGSGSGTPSIDNSKLTQTQNSLGYYGKATVFGNMEISRGWNIYNNNEYTGLLWHFSTDGVATYFDFSDGDRQSHDFGVSKDGKTIKIAENSSPTIITYQSSAEAGCMIISIKDERVFLNNIKMCKTDSHPDKEYSVVQ